MRTKLNYYLDIIKHCGLAKQVNMTEYLNIIERNFEKVELKKEIGVEKR